MYYDMITKYSINFDYILSKLTSCLKHHFASPVIALVKRHEKVTFLSLPSFAN